MTNIKLRFYVTCDWRNRTRACAADSKCSGDPRRGSLATFRKESIAMLKKEKGWFIRGNFCLCAEHNTAANRKKKFKCAEPGSLADLMRNLRSGE